VWEPGWRGHCANASDFGMPIVAARMRTRWGMLRSGNKRQRRAEHLRLRRFLDKLKYGNADYILSFNGNSCAYTGSAMRSTVQASHTNPNVAYILEGVDNSHSTRHLYEDSGFGGRGQSRATRSYSTSSILITPAHQFTTVCRIPTTAIPDGSQAAQIGRECLRPRKTTPCLWSRSGQ